MRDRRRRRGRASAPAAGAGPAPPAWSARAGPARPRSARPVVPITPGRPTGGPEDRLQQVRDVVLPFVPVTPTVVIAVGGPAEERGRHGPHRLADRGDADLRPRRASSHRSTTRADGARGHRRGGEVVPVGARRRARRRTALRATTVRRVVGDVATDVRRRRRGRSRRRERRDEVGERASGGKAGVNRLRAYPRPRSRCRRSSGGPARGAGARRGGAGAMPRRWIAYRATCWNSGAAAMPP